MKYNEIYGFPIPDKEQHAETLGLALLPPERSIWRLGPAPVLPERSRWFLGRCLVLSRLEDCVRSGIQNCCSKNLLGATKLCCTTLNLTLLVHGCARQHIGIFNLKVSFGLQGFGPSCATDLSALARKRRACRCFRQLARRGRSSSPQSRRLPAMAARARPGAHRMLEKRC